MQTVDFDYSGKLEMPAGLKAYIVSQKTDPASFIEAVADDAGIEAAGELAAKYAKSKGLVVIGIGGSNLGTMAIWKALKAEGPVYFAETFDARGLGRIIADLKHPVVYAIVSKSGTTSETVANAAVLLGQMKKGDTVVAITDEGSKLWQLAKENKFDALVIPSKLGGRYSVFSAVGLFPLAVAEVNIEKLISGAKLMSAACLSENLAENPAAQSALAIFQNLKAGKPIHDIFIFEPDLEYFGRWYRQMIGESLGKDGQGITPTVSVGTTDLHSVGQLYLDGPKDKFTTFVSVKDRGADFSVDAGSVLAGLVPDIAGKQFSSVLSAVLSGAKAAYKKQGLPFAELSLSDISEETLGGLMQMKMFEIIYLAQLMGVNAFDQPAVELYKEETRKALKEI